MRPFTFPDQINPFTFPDQINEVSARLVAAGVVLMCAATLAFRQPWLLVPLAYGFFARVLSGPRFSPLAQLVTRVVTPMIPVAAKLVPGPPKRFAQAVGLVMASTAAVLALGFGFTTAAYAITGLIVVAAVLESGFGFCVGCTLFAALMRLGIVPADVCAACNNLSRVPPAGSGKEPRVPVL
jgi:hypothetical protein